MKLSALALSQGLPMRLMVSIHKSQGSEYPAVVIPVMTQHYAMLQRNLLYTGLTRGKRLVVLVGQKKAVAIAVHNVSTEVVKIVGMAGSRVKGPVIETNGFR